MKCRGNFIFKGIKLRVGGTFTNDNGQSIPYKEAYIVKFDIINEETGEVSEQTTKVSTDKGELIQKLTKIELYRKVTFEFNIIFSSRGIIAELCDVGIVKE